MKKGWYISIIIVLILIITFIYFFLKNEPLLINAKKKILINTTFANNEIALAAIYNKMNDSEVDVLYKLYLYDLESLKSPTALRKNGEKILKKYNIIINNN